MPSQTGERGYHVSRSYPLPASTPDFRMPAETPLAKIQPVFDNFSLAEMSDYLEPPTPAPPHSHTPASPPRMESSRPADVFDATPKDPRIKRLQHKTPDTKRRRREEFYTPGAAAHPDDFFSRRLTDSSRRTSLVPLNLDRELQGSSLASATASSSTLEAASQTAQRPNTQALNDPLPAPKTMPPVRGPSRAERARAAGIPVLTSRTAARPARAPRPVAVGRKDPPVPQPARPKPCTEAPPPPSSASIAPLPPPSPETQSSMPTCRKSNSAVTSSHSSSRPATVHNHPTKPSLSHETPPSRTHRHSTPASLVSIAAHASTLDGLPEFWDLSMSTPSTASPAKVSWEARRLNLPSVNDTAAPLNPNPTPLPEEGERNRCSEREPDAGCPRGEKVPLSPSSSSSINPSQASSQQTPAPSQGSSRQTSAPTQRNSTPPSRPPSRVDTAVDSCREQQLTPAEHSRRESCASSFFGFLTAVFGASPLPAPAAASAQPAMRSASGSHVTRPAQPPPVHRPPSAQQPPLSKRQPRGDDDTVRPMPKKETAAAGPKSKPHEPQPPRPKTQRQPLSEARGNNVNVDQAPLPRPKRKQPPSPVKAQPAVGASVPPTLPSYARSTSASRFATANQAFAAAKPPRTTMRPHSRTTLRTSSSASTYSHSTAPPRVTTFVADHLARMPMPGEGASKHSVPVFIRDHERARELAIKRAVFERLPNTQSDAPSQSNGRRHVSAPISTTHTTKPSTVPGEATRRRAEIQAANRERRRQKDAEEALRKAEEARIRAAVEAAYDRQARERAVFRANPLPEMYGASRHA